MTHSAINTTAVSTSAIQNPPSIRPIYTTACRHSIRPGNNEQPTNNLLPSHNQTVIYNSVTV